MIAKKDVIDVRRCVIVGGAEIRTYDRVRQYFRPDDFFIYCDCGLRHQAALGAEPDLIVGDFDSHEKPETDRETIVLPVKKDDTDTVFAAKEAMRRGFDEFLLAGVSGGRLDHTLVNVYLLVMLREQGKRALLVDDYSEMELVGAEKPSPAFFGYVFDHIGPVEKPEVLMVGDSLTSDMRGGLQAGIPCCWYNPKGLPLPEGMALDYVIHDLNQVEEILSRS